MTRLDSSGRIQWPTTPSRCSTLTVRDKRCGLESKYAQEVALFPDSISCNASHVASSTCTNPPQPMQAAYFLPQPDPKNIFGVVGLSPPPGTGSFDGKRPVAFRVLVVPCYSGTGANDIQNCATVSIGNPNDPADRAILASIPSASASARFTAPPPISVTLESSVFRTCSRDLRGIQTSQPPSRVIRGWRGKVAGSEANCWSFSLRVRRVSFVSSLDEAKTRGDCNEAGVKLVSGNFILAALPSP